MHIIDHKRHGLGRRKARRGNRPIRSLCLFTTVALLGYSGLVGLRFFMPVSSVKPTAKYISRPAEAVTLSWPAYGQSAAGELHAGLLASTSGQTPQPIASVTKVMTALAIMRAKPLQLGQAGPTITLTAADVQLYNNYISNDGSVVKVVAGEKITQYQALQAMLLPSANNMADTMAGWAFGSVQEYTKYANSLAVSLGMKQTTIADASGFSSNTVSTANDILLLGQAALKEPVLAEIVNQSSATIPVQGEIRNVNYLLGIDGINGIKTGNTEEAGGCFVVSASRTLSNGQKKTILAVILGAPVRNTAINDSRKIVSQVEQNYVSIPVAKAGQIVGYYSSDWGQTVPAVIRSDLSVFAWKGAAIKPQIQLDNVSAPGLQGAKVGSIGVAGQSAKTAKSDVVLQSRLQAPSARWRFTRATQF